jgi:DNA-binding PadR family transcriptional regulator
MWGSMADARSASEALPLNPRVFAILMALSEGEVHGYRIKRSVEEASGGAISIDPGSLYRSIARMVDDGWIAESEARPDSASDDVRRRYYGLTGDGLMVLRAEAARLAGLVDAARALNLV